MAKLKSIYLCASCGYESIKWLGKCPNCASFNTFNEEIVEKNSSTITTTTKSLTPSTLKSIETSNDKRIKTNINELDRVLNGGIVQGSLTLVGGDPGIGKSTLLLQICQSIGNNGHKILYISGEESVKQIKLRADRLNITTDKLLLLSETNMNLIESTVKEIMPSLLIIDSIQTMFLDELSSAPGSVSQVRECTNIFMKIGKGLNVSVIIVGHVTKDGAIAGPKVLEHIVDTVLYFEGERRASYRLLRAVKNRFGSTHEVGVFEMCETGLAEISNPSEYMLSGRPLGVSGSVISCSMEGTMPILMEVQSLVSYTNFGVPRRMATGMDYNRVILLIAVLEKKLGMQLGTYDSYVNLTGGIKTVEPSIDAAVICAIASSYRNRPVDPFTAVFGEVGLAGEMRAVSMAEKRILEASKMGFKKCIVPKTNMKGFKQIDNIEIYGVSNVNELLDLAL